MLSIPPRLVQHNLNTNPPTGTTTERQARSDCRAEGATEPLLLPSLPPCLHVSVYSPVQPRNLASRHRSAINHP